ncbi:hypothetical protein [Spirosoma foliorum]|uniref:Uncharacterized protein n=1 Tax=Spirosoma foliorum TaxID=2710596 RepID=A0A7G5H2K4_9BACT|nr:hypothetical protein [Spirosoma foliorum]QMW05346.1 hypothetical protein H3H32_10875 [Spirosoma foliorum]
MVPSDLREPYGPKPYPVDISAMCGLATLKTRPLLETDGKRLQGNYSVSHLLRLILFQTGISSQIVTGMNLYETSDMAAGQTIDGLANPARDSLYQTLINAEFFLNSDGTAMNCYEALGKILHAFPGLRITQLEGIWWIIRTPEASGSWDVWPSGTDTSIHIRRYTNSSLSAPPSSHESIDLNVFTDHLGELRVINEGPETVLQELKNAIRVEQSFGNYRSKLPNGNFLTVDETNLPINWTRALGLTQSTAYRVGTGADTDLFRLHIDGFAGPYLATMPVVTTRIDYRTPSDQAKSAEYTKSLKRTLKGTFWNSGTAGAQIGVIAVCESGDATALYALQEGGSWVRNPTNEQSQAINIRHAYTLDNVEYSTPGPCEINIPMDGLDRVVEIRIGLGAGRALVRNGSVFTGPPTPWIEYANMRMEVATEGLNLDGTQRTIAKPGKVPDGTAQSVVLGDVPDGATPYSRLGTLFTRGISDTPVTTTRWYRPDADITATTPAPKDKGETLLTWLAELVAYQSMFGTSLWDGPLVGRFPYGPHTAVNVEGLSATYTLTRWSWKLREAEQKARGPRIMPTADLSSLDKLNQWQTPDGVIPMNEGDDGNPIEPVFNQPLTPHQQFLKNAILAGIKLPKPQLSPIVPGHLQLTLPAGQRVPTLTVLGNNGFPLGTFLPGFRKAIDLNHLL